MKELGPYEIVGELGRGGAGIVYRARHAALGRLAALKVLKEPSPKTRERFEREAQAAAKLRHPNIVVVYDAGQAGDAAYIAMELVEGRTLADALRQGTLSLRQRVEIVAKVAEAVQHAHVHGVVHRDLKPGNVLIDVAGQPRVVDFGLARLVETESSLTRTGAMVGTPLYMSPEQVRGEPVGPWSDVWGLGALLYESIAGRAAFHAEQIEDVYRRILTEDPPSAPGAAAELDVVCRKAMEKSPARRYPSAGAMAADLRRWLEGRPIEARAPGPAERLRRAMVRRPAATAALVAGVAAAALATALLVPRIRRTEARLTETQAALLRRMRDTTDAYVELALSRRRAGDLAGMRAQVAKAEAVCRECAEQMPGLAEPHRRLGRVYRAARRVDEALAAQDAALARDPSDAEARYERGLLRMTRYSEELRRGRSRWLAAQAERVGGEPGVARTAPAVETDAARAWRAKAEEDLAAAGGRPAAAALLAMLRGDTAAARAGFEAEVARNPDAEEAYDLLAQLAIQAGDPERAADWCARGLERDRGAVDLAIGRTQACLDAAAKGGSRWFDEAVAAADRAVELEPSAEALSVRAMVRVARAGAALGEGRDAGPEFERAVADLDAAVASAPERPDLRAARGGTRVNWATNEGMYGRDGAALLHAAVADFDDALRLGAAGAVPRVGRGYARMKVGVEAEWVGRPGEAFFRDALADFEEAVRMDPLQAQGWSGRGWARCRLGVQAEARGGADAEELYREAVADCEEALRLEPGRADALSHRAETRYAWARCVANAGQDARARFEQVIQDYGELIAKSGGIDAVAGRGAARSSLGHHLRQRGEDPRALFEEAIEDFDEAIRRRPKQWKLWLHRGMARLNAAEHRSARGGDASDGYRRAIADLEEAVRLAPGDAEAQHQLGMARGGLLNHWRDAKPRDGAEMQALYRACCDAFGAAMRLSPSRVDSRWRRGMVRYLMLDLRGALEDFETSVRADARLEKMLRPYIENVRARLEK